MFNELKKIQKLYIQGTFLKGPIPASLSSLNLTELRISDLKGNTGSKFPNLSDMKSIKGLIMRSCLLTGNIPDYLGNLENLTNLDLSFNNLTGEIPASLSQLTKVENIYLTENKLTGPIPRWILERSKLNVDISKNNFTWTDSGPVECPHGSVNLVESYSSAANNLSQVHSCLQQGFPCSNKQYYHAMHVNCGGKMVRFGNKTPYEADLEPKGISVFSEHQHWAFSSTGDFLDTRNADGSYIKTNTSALALTNTSMQLYTTARVSPLSLTYYGLCLHNGKYTVKLHFAEIILTNSINVFTSLGERVFDVYIQGELIMKDFNIAKEAGGASTPIVKTFIANVVSNTLEIHFYWAGRGTQCIPFRGNYGPLISAIAVSPNFKPPSSNHTRDVIIISATAVVFVILVILTVFCLLAKFSKDKDLSLDPAIGRFTLKQIKKATKNFHVENKIGEGGFGAVYKGILPDRTKIAVKQLSSRSRQGNREFLNELGMISALQHPNLVKLYGCCVEEKQLMLVYEYMENNCLSDALFGKNNFRLDWPARRKIIVGIARGLAFLHEESPIRIVHRDIKLSNILLDEEMNAKISDFGLAKLNEDDNTHISTRIAGTIGYMSPEYSQRGLLTNKADVYSFGVVVVEIVTRKGITNHEIPEDFVSLIHWAYELQETRHLSELVDPELGSDSSSEEVISVFNLALMCTNRFPTQRPTMSQVVRVLEGRTALQHLTSNCNRNQSPEPSIVSETSRIDSSMEIEEEESSFL